MRRLTRPVVLTTCLLGFFAAQFAVATPVLVVHGAVTRPNGSPAVGVTVAVTNVTRALSQEAPKPTDARGLYGVAFVDYLGDVARATDELLIQVIAAGSVLGEVTHLVTAAETVSTEVVVDVMLLDPPTFVYRNSWVSEPTAETKNGQADPGERVKPRVRLKNEGASDARNVVVALSIDDPDVTVVEGTVTHATWPTGEARDNVGFVVDIAPGTAAHDVDVTINVTADNGGPWRFSFSFPVVLPFPAFSQRNAWIFDPTPDAYQDGLAEPGERVRPRIRLANDGTADATNVRTTLVITDPDVTVISGTEVSAQWPRGDARNIGGFVVDISNRATPHDVTAIVTVTADSGGPWGFSFTFPIVAPTLTFSYRNSWIFEPNAEMKNGQADPGERVKPRVRLRNEGSRAAQNVVVALSTDDPDVTIVEGTVNHATWPLGEARDNVGFVVDIAPGTDPHDVRVIVDVSAQNGGPWQFSFTFPVVLPLPAFDPRNAWIYDPAPGAYQDGFAEAGERVRPRIRLRNDGTADATNVRVTLAINDPDVTVTRGDEAHTTWPRDQARTVQGFVVEIATNATPHDVEAVVTVTADTGGPWRFPFTFPVVAPTLIFTHRNSWVFEPSAETKNGQADPGERIHPRVRLKNEGSRDAQNVVVTLEIDDPDVTVVKDTVTYATWPMGEAYDNVGLVVDIAPEADPHDVSVIVNVAAANGGPWQFSFTFPVVASLTTLSITAPEPNEELPANTGSVDLRVAISNRGVPWHWRLNSRFPLSGPAGGTPNVDGDVATITGLTEGRSYTVYVTLVDADGNVLDPALTTSVQFSVASPPMLDITAPEHNDVLVAGSSSVQVSVAITGHAGTWHWRLEEDSEPAGPAGGAVADRPTATVDGLRNGRTYEVFVTLVDAGGVAITPTVARSVRFSVANWPPTGVTLRGVDSNTRRPKLEVRANEGSRLAEFSMLVHYDTSMFSRPDAADLRAGPDIRLDEPSGRDGQITISGSASPALAVGTGETLLFALEFSATKAEEDDSTVRVSEVTLADSSGNDIEVTSIDPESVLLETSRHVQLLGNRAETWGLIKRRAGVPSETALLPNYPNPFNPDTWIPFNLAEASEVAVRVYDVAGREVRHIDLGYRDAGFHRDRADAAYWDGRNESGEPVASGVYVYELQAGPFREMRRMLVRK